MGSISHVLSSFSISNVIYWLDLTGFCTSLYGDLVVLDLLTIYQQSINNLSTNLLWYCDTVGTFGDFSQNRGCCKHYNIIFVKTIDKCKIIVTFGDCKQKITENGKN